MSLKSAYVESDEETVKTTLTRLILEITSRQD